MRRGRPERVAHVVQAVEGGHQVEAARLERLRADDLEASPGRRDPASAARSRADSIEPSW